MQNKRDFLTCVGLALAAAAIPAFAQEEGGPRKVPTRTAKTTPLFKAPCRWPNALCSSPQGLWIGEQNLKEHDAASVGLAWPTTTEPEKVYLVDMNGKLLKTVKSDASNTMGLAVGNGSIWIASGTVDKFSGFYQIDLATGKQLSHRQVPLSVGGVSDSIHGAEWRDGKIWLVNDRMHSIMRLDPKTWTPEMQIPLFAPANMPRYHGMTFDKDGTILLAVANRDTHTFKENVAGLARMDAQTGKPLEIITFEPGSCDPHGLALHNGMLLGCDAGYHPQWPKNYDSPYSGMVFRIDIA